MSRNPAPLKSRPATEARDGLLFVDKPAGITSHDVVAVVRRAARTRRVGHAGTLDPFATGLLVLAVGSHTRLLQYLDAEPKVYEARIAFGRETLTDDATGAERARAPLPDMSWLDEVIAHFTGELDQVPPSYSARHVDGERAYDLARRGIEPQLTASRVTVWSWQVIEANEHWIDTRITCSGGTYIRSLARDLGRALDSAAHCARLRRLASGPITVADAVGLPELLPGSIADGTIALQSPLLALSTCTPFRLDDAGVAALQQGRALPARDASGSRVVFLDEDSTIRGVGELVMSANDAPMWQPRVVFPQVDAP